jgi:tetratricopeptide (TPR) repeat protein
MKNARAISILVLFVLGSAMACSRADETPDALMKSGVDSLYAKSDPEAAAKAFRKVLAKNPEHYGANFQLAVALDRSGKAAEARPLWEKTLAMAEAIKDEKTADTARKQLGQPGSSPEDAAMKAGLDALYEKKDAVAAIVEFRKVLEMNPNHYGATFQLAKALDQVGKPADARPLWEKALKMAEGFKDAETAKTAKDRLARRP